MKGLDISNTGRHNLLLLHGSTLILLDADSLPRALQGSVA